MFTQKREHTSSSLKVHSQYCYFPTRGLLQSFDDVLVHAPDKKSTHYQPLLQSVLS